MYRWEKSTSDEKFRKNHKNPSFSSTLLDEVYRSIDGGDKVEELKMYKEKAFKKHSSVNGGIRAKSCSIIEDEEEMASFKRASMIEKWMDKKISDKASVRKRESGLQEVENKLTLDSDPLFFSSGSNSSDSSFGGFSSSETESLGAHKLRVSCFHGLKPVKINVSTDHRKQDCSNSLTRNQSELYLLDDHISNHQTNNKIDEGLIKTKLRALKIYDNLKKLKQPISPGGRLTSFINSLFTNGNSKKAKNSGTVGGGYEDPSVERKAKSTQASTCSSASSFSRSCLSKNSPNTRQRLNNGIKRTVRFDPVSVIVDEHSRPCGQKSIYGENIQKNGRSAVAANAEVQLHLLERTKKIEAAARDVLRGYHQNQNQHNADFYRVKYVRDKNYQDNAADNYGDEDDDDALGSDCSSDLFELDHLALFGNDRFREELPVYETTHFDTNRAIASGFIR